MKKTWRIKIVIALFVSAFMIASCGEKSAQNGKTDKNGIYVSFFAGDVKLKRANNESIKVKLKLEVKKGDIFTVGKKSALVLQGTDGLVVRFNANTKAEISSLDGLINRELTLKKGRVLSSVNKLKKGNNYSVKTPTAVASVRGTQFLTSFDGKKSRVAVGRGLVKVKSTKKGGGEELVGVGKTALSNSEDGKVEVRELNKVEKLNLEVIESTPEVKDVAEKTPAELEKIFQKPEKEIKKIEKKLDLNAGMSFSDMKKKYGRIDVITLYSGKVISGVILSRGANYKVLTERGTINIRAKKVRQTRSK